MLQKCLDPSVAWTLPMWSGLAAKTSKREKAKFPVTRNRTRDHLMSAQIYSQMLYQLSYDRHARVARKMPTLFSHALSELQCVGLHWPGYPVLARKHTLWKSQRTVILHNHRLEEQPTVSDAVVTTLFLPSYPEGCIAPGSVPCQCNT